MSMPQMGPAPTRPWLKSSRISGALGGELAVGLALLGVAVLGKGEHHQSDKQFIEVHLSYCTGRRFMLFELPMANTARSPSTALKRWAPRPPPRRLRRARLRVIRTRRPMQSPEPAIRRPRLAIRRPRHLPPGRRHPPKRPHGPPHRRRPRIVRQRRARRHGPRPAPPPRSGRSPLPPHPGRSRLHPDPTETPLRRPGLSPRWSPSPRRRSWPRPPRARFPSKMCARRSST